MCWVLLVAEGRLGWLKVMGQLAAWLELGCRLWTQSQVSHYCSSLWVDALTLLFPFRRSAQCLVETV